VFRHLWLKNLQRQRVRQYERLIKQLVNGPQQRCCISRSAWFAAIEDTF
jgi:hypothetical protein